jgi:dTDP-4-amino-4,6-dideoxygalactose transaminase
MMYAQTHSLAGVGVAQAVFSSAGNAIPFSRPFYTGKEAAAIAQALATHELAGDGAITKRVHALLERELGVKKALLTTSCTHALEISALLLDLKPGDEVIVPAFTFVSTANAFALHGAKTVFADVRPDTLNMDEKVVESLITSRTRAIVPVHYAGVACEMDTLLRIAEKHGLALIEDNAHGLFAKYKGKYLGTMGALGTQSFHETKNFTCGEGGALLINDSALQERAEIIREKGTDRSRFFRGQVDKYTWRDVGSSYLPSGMLAAFLYEQLSAREQIQGARKRIFDRYNSELSGWAHQNGVQLPTIPAEVEQAYHMFYMLLPSMADRAALIDHLKAEQITATFHYVPLNSSAMGLRMGGRAGACPVTEDISDRLVRLPFFTGISAEQQARVIERVASFKTRA